MIAPIFSRPVRTPSEILGHNELRCAQNVARKLEGTPKPRVPTFNGRTSADLARHRELEIDITTDLGWGDADAIRLMNHHAQEAARTAEAYSRDWCLITFKGGVGGCNNLTKRAFQMIDSLRARVDPANYVASAEFDPRRVLQAKYFQSELKHQDLVRAVELKNKELRKQASQYVRARIRKNEREELQCVLDSFASDVRTWQVQLNKASKEVGFF
jgi:hypothetical protein